MLDKRLVIITGHYGSGKTEFAVNYAIKMLDEKENYENISIADLDIVNPYFRTREKKDFLEKKGIKVYGSSIKNSSLDLPALPAEVMGIIQNQKLKSILDVGGDPVGARVLARFSELIKNADYDLFFVINANRLETGHKDKTIDYLRKIEEISNLKVTGLINNTHLLKATTVDDIERGHELTKQVSWEMDIPIRYETAIQNVVKDITNQEIIEKLFPINMYMREEWMS